MRLFLAITLLLTLAVPTIAQEQPLERPSINIASWNIRFLTSNSRDDSEVQKIATMIRLFDLVAIQEARDTDVLDRICRKLPGWRYTASRPVGRGQKEIYAFMWNDALVDIVGTPALLPESQDVFIREPFAATFKAGEFDFTLTTIHLLFGNSKTDRRRELVLMDDVAHWVQRTNGKEQDVILLGDFNFDPLDIGWELDGWTALFRPPIKTTIGGKSLYDNIWFVPTTTKEYARARGMVKFDETIYGGDLRLASLEMSDHRPIWASFWTDVDDDENEYGKLFGGMGTTATMTTGAPRAVGRDNEKPVFHGNRAGEPSSSQEASRQGGKSVVFRTKTGKKYHLEGCRSLSRSKISIRLEEARRMGLEPCKVCGGTRK